jgi:acylphosphatase
VTATEIRLEGRLASTSFVDWICHRARLLDLSGWVQTDGPGALTIVVSGPQALIDAMEMACSLGPMDVQVDRVACHTRALNAQPNGFMRR